MPWLQVLYFETHLDIEDFLQQVHKLNGANSL